MPSFAKHCWSFYYIYLRLLTGLLRCIAAPGRWADKRRQMLAEGAVYKRIQVPSRDAGRSIKVDLYQPPDYDSTKPTPVLVNMHGYVMIRILLCPHGMLRI